VYACVHQDYRHKGRSNVVSLTMDMVRWFRTTREKTDDAKEETSSPVGKVLLSPINIRDTEFAAPSHMTA
jgi:hypothetical protein